jgi:D-glycero-beta-D-manno-heptose 1-phosphate adenylyltransferase
MNEVTNEARELLKAKLIELKAAGKKIGYTSGAFDILHYGHLDYLTKAKEFCDVLIVGVNTDCSIKGYKSELRPVVGENERLGLVKGLKPVDYAFLFNELNNNVNIELLKPDFYIKADDYSTKKLSSQPIIEAYGGQVQLIPLVQGLSTTAIIEKIQCLAKIAPAEEIEYPEKPAAFLDRDGTLIKLVDYLDDPERVEILPTVIEGLLKLQEHGFRLIITTNQPGIGMGYYTKDDFYKVTIRMLKLLSDHKIMIDKIYYSPHSKADNSRDRKPRPGMIERAVRDLNIDLNRSIVIGDSTVDIEFANRGKVPYSGLVLTGKGGADGLCEVKPTVQGESFLEVVDKLLESLIA